MTIIKDHTITDNAKKNWSLTLPVFLDLLTLISFNPQGLGCIVNNEDEEDKTETIILYFIETRPRIPWFIYVCLTCLSGQHLGYTYTHFLLPPLDNSAFLKMQSAANLEHWYCWCRKFLSMRSRCPLHTHTVTSLQGNPPRMLTPSKSYFLMWTECQSGYIIKNLKHWLKETCLSRLLNK